MKNPLLFLLILLFPFWAFIANEKRPVHLFMAGDSTMADKVLYKPVKNPVTGESLPEPFPERGWGMLLREFFTDEITIDNRAKNGRSTRSFREEGLWNRLLSDLRKGDYVVIQFGHNDASVEKKERYASPEEYKNNLTRFVEEVRAKGGNPVLCTPVVRRKFDAQGKIADSHGIYPELVRQAAKETKTPLIDMHEQTREWLNREGAEQSTAYFMHIPAGVNKNFPAGLTDNTHFVEAGARHAAALFVEEIERQSIKGLTSRLKKNVSPYVSSVWVSDLRNGTYQNPVLHADYSDPDVCRVGEDYYLTASSFNAVPGLPVLHSKDLVNWTLIGSALPRLQPEPVFSVPQHGNGVWAPSIRYHNDEFYIYYGDPDQGIYMTRTKNPAGEWEPLTQVKAGKGLIDACPFWDEDGQAYLVHAYAGSRAGIKSLLAITRLTPDGKQAIGSSQTVYDGHAEDETIEGPKLYKRNGYYYLFAPAGGVATGWQTVLRSKNIWGPYERKVVLSQGNTAVNGPHQGAWVDTPSGEDWFIHFQDVSAYGRVMHLQPMQWLNDWPVIGIDNDGDGCGEPVAVYQKPNAGREYPVATPVESDAFASDRLGLQWQWHANPADWWYFTDTRNGCLRLFSVPVPSNYKNLWDLPNLLLQKFPARRFTATVKLRFSPNPKTQGERTGLLVMGSDYALLSLENTANGITLSQNECPDAANGTEETVNERLLIAGETLYLRVNVDPDAQCVFSYSSDGKKYRQLGKAFTAKEGKWIGAKVGLFCSGAAKSNDSGYVDVDWFEIEP